jgi:signal transduction histidine kinase/PAS domain-containing protein
MNRLINSTPPRDAETAERAFTQFLLEALPSGAFILDPQGKIAAVNLQAEMLLGWAAPMLEGQIAHELLECRAEDTADGSAECPITSALRGGSVLPSGQMLVRCGDDSVRPIEYKCIPYPTLAGLGAILTFRDLTHELELEKDVSRLAAIAEESPIAIVELNEDANLMYANPAMMFLIERFGFSSEARPVILPGNIAKLTAHCLDTGKDVGGIDVSVAGTHYEWKLFPMAQEKLVRGYGMDLTARKRAEIELTRAKAKSEVASQAKSKFLANMSDEIRRPVEDILSEADQLAECGLNKEQLEHVRAVKSASASLLTSIDDILAISALETGTVSVETMPVNFRAFMAKTTSGFIGRAEEKGLQLTIAISNQVPALIYCDASPLGKLLHSLLSNAINFTERGEVIVEVDRDTICASATAEELTNSFYLFFTISDTGTGISQQEQEAIFALPEEHDGLPPATIEEAGFRFILSKQLVDLMGGTIGIEKEQGKGSKIWFSLSVREAKRGTMSHNGNSGDSGTI